jgi:hypothetical protein
VDAHLGIRDFLEATELPDDDDASFPDVDRCRRGLRDADRDVGGGVCLGGGERERASCCCKCSICLASRSFSSSAASSSASC